MPNVWVKLDLGRCSEIWLYLPVSYESDTLTGLYNSEHGHNNQGAIEAWNAKQAEVNMNVAHQYALTSVASADFPTFERITP